MIGKISSGGSFGGCMSYISREKQDKLPKDKQVWRVLGSDGVRLDIGEDNWRKSVVQDMERPMLSRSEIKEPCGHISLGFSPKDSDRLTDDYMLKIAEEYMEKMGITDTPYIIVRHTDKPHPHCHIMFSRVDYGGKIIKSATNRYRNKAVCLDLTRHHNLTMGTDSLSLDPEKLRGSERSKVEIRQIANEVLSNSAVLNVAAFIARMKDRGVKVEVLRDKTPEQKIKTLIYRKGNHSFVASKIGKRFTPNNVIKELNRHAAAQRQAQPQHKPRQPEPIVIPPLPDVVCGVKIDRLRQQEYQEGKFISIGICDPGGVVPINHWIWYDFDKREPVMSRTYPYGHTIPEAFQRQLAAKQSPASSSQGAEIRFSSPSLSGNIPEEQGFAHGDGVPDDFKHFLEMHPGMSFEEAKRRFKDEQKAKQRRKGPKLH